MPDPALLALRPRLAPEEMRERILDVAEEQFRRVGYAKTAVADLAAALGMSAANVYRFFPSKAAINDALCRRCLDGGLVVAREAAGGPGTAAERLERLALAVHRYNKGRLTHEHRLHDMVVVAMDESWPAIEAHIGLLKDLYAGLVREGVAAGEFAAADPDEVAETLFHALARTFHPILIAQCADEDLEGQAVRLVAFVLRALRP